MLAARKIKRDAVELTSVDSDGRRKAAVAPTTVTSDMSLFEYLAACQPALDKKIIEVVLAQTKIPQDIRDDAAQEIRLAWSLQKPDTGKYKAGQIASYAHRCATHAALKLRRELGGSVRLPGSAFRKRKDGSSYVTPGMLAAPLDWNELESWFNTDSLSESSEAMSTPMAASMMPDITELAASEVAEAPEIDTEEQTQRARFGALERVARRLSRRQYQVMQSLIAGVSLDDIETTVGLKKTLALREFSIAAGILGAEAMGRGEAQLAH